MMSTSQKWLQERSQHLEMLMRRMIEAQLHKSHPEIIIDLAKRWAGLQRKIQSEGEGYQEVKSIT